MLNYIDRLINWTDTIKYRLKSCCYNLTRKYGNSFITALIKGVFSLLIFFFMLIPTWIGVSLFVLITWSAGVESGFVMLLTFVVLACSLILPQLWLGFIGVCMIALVLLA